VNPSSGSGRFTIDTPLSDSTEPARTIPAIFAGAVTSRTSSTAPVQKIRNAAARVPTMLDRDSKIWPNCPTRDATTIPTINPTNIAAPPKAGVGDVCTRRSLGIAIAPPPMCESIAQWNQRERGTGARREHGEIGSNHSATLAIQSLAQTDLTRDTAEIEHTIPELPCAPKRPRPSPLCREACEQSVPQ
jgi:hypothetical protein